MVELEYDKITMAKAAQTVAATVGGTMRYEETHLSNRVVTIPDGRKWNCETDASGDREDRWWGLSGGVAR